MAGTVDLYDNAYARAEHDLYRQIRMETYGRDLGQTSWVSAEESDEISTLLEIERDSDVLEVGCGSGLYAMHVARSVGCRIAGVDLNPHAVAAATRLAVAAGLEGAVQFQQCDVSKPLDFGAERFDAAFANDVLCHVAARSNLLNELFRVLRPKARLLFSDALVIGGMISHAEIATRSSIGPYFFSPPGENERLLEAAGFTVLSAKDTSQQAAKIAERWLRARQNHAAELSTLEGREGYEGLQSFLECVEVLTSERRLLRLVYVAEK
jgi:ubiquinone/menaquinone biosynthesis C-methylase UbiE